MQLSLLDVSNAEDTARIRVDELRRQLEHHNRLYYLPDAPVISDTEYDAFFRELQRLEAQSPGFVSPDLPTRRVGGAALDKFSSVTHRLPMLSLENATNADEIREFDLRVKKTLVCRRKSLFPMFVSRRWTVWRLNLSMSMAR